MSAVHQVADYTSGEVAFQEVGEDLAGLVRVADVFKRVGGILACEPVSGGRRQCDGDLPAMSRRTSSPPGCSSKNFVAS